MGFIGNLAKSFAKKKAEDKITNKEENNSSFITDMIKDFIKDHLKIIILIIIGFLILFIIIFGVFSAIFGDDDENKKNTEDNLTLTIGDNGLFKTTASKDGHWFSPDTYKFYAVLDENKFREFISTNGLGDKFGKEESTTGMYEDQESFLEGNIKSSTTQDTSEDNTSTEEEENTSTENNKLTKKEKEKLMKEYGLLKETIIRIAAASYPEDVIFVLNKTLIFDGDEDSTNQDLIDEKINTIIKQSDTKVVSGGVSLYRNGSSKKLKYVATEQELDDAYYTMKAGKVVVSYVETIKEKQGGKGIQEDTFETKAFDLPKLVAPYVMDVYFIQGLHARLNSEQFIYYLLLLISQSHIDVGIYENTTKTTTTMEEKVKEKEVDKETRRQIGIERTYTKEQKTKENIEKDLKMWVLKVDNWVATIENKITYEEGKEKILDKNYTNESYNTLINNLKNNNAPDELIEKINDKLNEFYEKTEEDEEDENIEVITTMEKLHYKMESETKSYKLDEEKSEVKDNTDYFCGLIRNSTSKAVFNKDFYTPENDYFKELNAYTLKSLWNIRDAKSIKNIFHTFDVKGKSMLYAQTGTNRLICPDERLSSEAQRQEFLVISNGKYNETINLIWDKLCGIKVDGKEVLEEIAFRELEAEDINETNLNLKSFIKSMEGTKIVKSENKDLTYHKTYVVEYESNNGKIKIAKNAWGLNLYDTYNEFEEALGEIVYSPAFYEDGFLIPDNIIEIVFNKLVDERVNTITTEINKKNMYGYYLKDYERDALVYITWAYGGTSSSEEFTEEYMNCIKEAFSKSGIADLNDKSDRKKLYEYYDYLKTNIIEKYSNKINAFILYSHGLYYRKGGELFVAEKEPLQTEPLQTALTLYQKFVNEGYTYDDENAGFYQKDGNADDSGKYAEAQYDAEKDLLINDYEYVTWVYRDLGILSQTYTNYDSFMEGTLYNKKGRAEDLNKFDIIDNSGENGVSKTINSRDDLLPGDIVIVQEDDRKSIKIYGGRNNWLEMDNDTLEELKNVSKLKKSVETQSQAKRAADNKSTIWKLITPIANYKGNQSGADNKNVYGKTIDVNNILWVYRNKDLANNYIYNDSNEFSDYTIENHMLK